MRAIYLIGVLLRFFSLFRVHSLHYHRALSLIQYYAAVRSERKGKRKKSGLFFSYFASPLKISQFNLIFDRCLLSALSSVKWSKLKLNGKFNVIYCRYSASISVEFSKIYDLPFLIESYTVLIQLLKGSVTKNRLIFSADLFIFFHLDNLLIQKSFFYRRNTDWRGFLF